MGKHKTCQQHEHHHEHVSKVEEQKTTEQHLQHTSCCTSHAHELAPQAQTPALLKKEVAAGDQHSQWYIAAMDCPVEEGMIRKQLADMPEVSALEFNLLSRTLNAVHREGFQEAITTSIAELGMDPVLITPDNEEVGYAPDRTKQKRTLVWAISGLVLALISELLHFSGQPALLSAATALLAIALCGLGTYKKGWLAIKRKELNINALMSIAVTGAVLIGQWPEAAMVMALFTISELIEARTLERARTAIQGLLKLIPEVVTVQQPDGYWQEIPAKSVQIGHIVRVRPGQSIALDGVITQGHTSINQSAVTGESMPIDKTVGDLVFAGTLNESGEFQFKVTTTTQNSTLTKIIHAIEEAQSERAPTQRFIDKFARYYTPAVVLIAVTAALFLPFLSAEPLHAGLWLGSIYKALVILVIACPCALVISTPVTVVSALTAASRRGLLVKGGVYMETGRHLKWIALDKTGTITHGKPVQSQMLLLKEEHHGLSTQEIIASIAARSDHPVSMAIAQKAEHDGIKTHEPTSFEAVLGQGTRATINQLHYHLGNMRMMQELQLLTTEVESSFTQLEQQGQTVVALSSDQEILALVGVSDTIKPSSQEAIEQLQHLGVKTIMLSGDNQHTVDLIAQKAGINEGRGNLLPEDKQLLIEEKQALLQTQGDVKGIVGMVGDGINDAPALARADIGFSMGMMGTDTAMETADVAIMDDDLRKIPEFIILSKRTHSILIQNILLALGIKAVFLILAVLGLATMWMAVFADVGTSLIVIFNGLRMLKATPRSDQTNLTTACST